MPAFPEEGLPGVGLEVGVPQGVEVRVPGQHVLACLHVMLMCSACD